MRRRRCWISREWKKNYPAFSAVVALTSERRPSFRATSEIRFSEMLSRSMSPEDDVRLKHMIDAAVTALRFIERRGREELETDEMLVFALVRAIEIIGEAASKVSANARAEASSVPWSKIVGMRNRVIHAYFDVDLDILWATVTEALPTLVPQLRMIAGGGEQRGR